MKGVKIMNNVEESQKIRQNILNTLDLIKHDAHANLTCVEYDAINVLRAFIQMQYMNHKNIEE